MSDRCSVDSTTTKVEMNISFVYLTATANCGPFSGILFILCNVKITCWPLVLLYLLAGKSESKKIHRSVICFRNVRISHSYVIPKLAPSPKSINKMGLVKTSDERKMNKIRCSLFIYNLVSILVNTIS